MEQDRRMYIMKLINMFRQREELWNKNCFAYCQNDLKKKAFREIAQEMNLSEEFIKKKLRALRSTYIIEKRKVERSKKSAVDGKNVYEPSLFWYNEMTFLDGLIVMRKPIDQATNADPADFVERQTSSNKTNEVKILNPSDSNTAHSNADIAQKANVPSISFYNNSNGAQHDFSTNSLSEYEATGINVTKKLEKMNPIQAIYAESLINSVLRNGLLNKLTDDTIIYDGKSEAQIETSSTLFSSEFSLSPQTHRNNLSIQSPMYHSQNNIQSPFEQDSLSRQSEDIEFKVEVEDALSK